MPDLPTTALLVETYCFEYPSVDDLLQLLDTILGNDGLPFIDAHGCQGLRIAGLTHIDDFTFISPLDLCLVSRVWPEKVKILFAYAEDMIDDVHFGERKMIAEIKEYMEAL